jgi:hypothetical protein
VPDPTPVETKLRIAHQDFGAAKKRDTAINAREYRIGSGELCSDVIGDAILRVVKPAARPVARTLGLQPPDDREAAERPLPQFRIWIEVMPAMQIRLVSIRAPSKGFTSNISAFKIGSKRCPHEPPNPCVSPLAASTPPAAASGLPPRLEAGP